MGDELKHMLPGRPTTRRRVAVTSWRGLTIVTGAIAAAVGIAIVPGSAASAAPGSSVPASLQAVLNKANALSEQIDRLSQQYDGLQLQLEQARAEVKLADEGAQADEHLLGQDEKAIGAIAVEGFMTGGMNPVLQLLQTANPQSLLNRASIMTQLSNEDGAKMNLVTAAARAAVRAQGAAAQEQRQAVDLAKEMSSERNQIQQKENFFNGEAFKQAADIFQRTGHYPAILPAGDSIGIQALSWAFKELGQPYVWGGAAPGGFDCSGLVMWAYEHVGIQLEHFTGDQWNEIVHVPRDELKPGDLVFFFADISHVGLYIGNNLMIDAPTFGQVVQIQPLLPQYVGGGYVPG
jgi:peptidoglycan DL-endopeptidase CwlO